MRPKKSVSRASHGLSGAVVKMVNVDLFVNISYDIDSKRFVLGGIRFYICNHV